MAKGAPGAPEAPKASGAPQAPEEGKAPAAPALPEVSEEAQEVTPEIERALLYIGRVFDAIRIYGTRHPSVGRSGKQAYDHLTEVLEERGRMNLSVVEGALLVDGVEVTSDSPFIHLFTSYLERLDIVGFSIDKGLSLSEFGDLIEIIATEQRQRITDEKTPAMAHVQAEKVVYRRVRAGDLVVDEEKLTELTGAKTREQRARLKAFLLAGGAEEAVPGEGDAGGTGEGEAKGDGDGAGEGNPIAQAGEAIRALIEDDVANVADLILEVTEERQRADGSSGEVGKIAAEQLRRTYEALRHSSAVNTKKGRQQLRKAFQELENVLKDRLTEKVPEGGEETAKEVAATIGDITEELQIETLVADHTRTNKTLDKHEEKLLRYILRNWDKSDSAMALKERLVEAGLPVAMWANLIAKSGLSSFVVDGDRPAGALASGSMLKTLERLDALMGKKKAPPEEVRRVLESISSKVTDVSARAEAVMDEIANALEQDDDLSAQLAADDKGGVGRRKPLSWVWERLAELGQELLQPLTVINASVSMTMLGYAGDLTDEQRELLTTAEQAGLKLKALMDRLITIVGFPRSRHARPDIIYDEQLSGRGSGQSEPDEG